MFKKKNLLLLILAVPIFVIGVWFLQTSFVQADLDTCTGGACPACYINTNGEIYILAHDFRYLVKNTSSELDIFIPIRTASEWEEFRLFHPGHISIQKEIILTYQAPASGGSTSIETQAVWEGESAQTVEAIPEPNYVFVEWSDGVTDNPRTDTNVTEDFTVEPIFEYVPVNCPTQTLTWSTNCSASFTESAHNTSQTQSSTAFGWSGSATYSCNDGAWTYDSGTCEGDTCSSPWGTTTLHGSSATGYLRCSTTSTTLSCSTGTWDGDWGSYTYGSSNESCDACTNPWGGTTVHGASATGYSSESVACGTCPSQTLTCSDGTWSGTWGSFTYNTCTEGTCPSTTDWTCDATTPCQESRTAYTCSSNVCVESLEYRASDACGGCSGDDFCSEGSCVYDSCEGIDSVSFSYNGSGTTDGVFTANTVVRGGLCWLDRNLGASQVATSSADANSYGDLFQWGRLDDGHQSRNSTLTSTRSSGDDPGHVDFITHSASPWDWRSPQNNDLWQGVNGANNPCPAGWRVPTEAEINAERLSWGSQNSAGAYASTLKWPPAGLRSNLGSLLNVDSGGLVWSSTVSSSFSRYLSFSSSGAVVDGTRRARGGSVRCLRDFSHFAIKYSSTSGGTVTGDTEQLVAANGSGTSVEAVADSGYEFTQWSDGSTQNPRTDTNVTSDITVSAEFDIDYCYGQESVSFNYNGSGTNDGVFTANTVSRNGLCWLDRNLGASQAATSSTDANSYGDLFQWGRLDDGHQIRTSGTTAGPVDTDTPGSNFITSLNSPYDWRSPQNDDLWQGVNGTNNPCPAGWRVPTELELNAERGTWGSNNSAGAYASTLKWPVAGSRLNHGSLNLVGSYGRVWSSTVSSPYSRFLRFYSSGAFILSLNRANGRSVRCLRDFSHFAIKYSSTTGGTVTGDTVQVVADGGSGTSVEAVADSGYLFTQWSDGSTQNPRTDTNVTSDIDVVAEFDLFDCGSNTVTFEYNDTTETYGTVLNSTTGDCWLDRNLGASQVATSSTDANSYGDLFQWGRLDDGHQIRTSGETSTLSLNDDPGHGSFITSGSYPYDWRNPQNTGLWQGVPGINNPCPPGWRLPTEAELDTERGSWSSQNSAGAYASTLKWPVAGFRSFDGSLHHVGSSGLVWSSTVSSSSRFLFFSSSGASIPSYSRAYGFSVRCLRD